MPRYTPEELRSELLNPLMSVLGELSQMVTELETHQKDGKVPKYGVTLQGSAAMTAVSKFFDLRDDLQKKLRWAEEGRLETKEKRIDVMTRQRAKKK